MIPQPYQVQATNLLSYNFIISAIVADVCLLLLWTYLKIGFFESYLLSSERHNIFGEI